MWLGRGPTLSLDGEGVFEFFHALFQILDFASLFIQEDMFDSVQSRLYQFNF
jgi:hypothetical protein